MILPKGLLNFTAYDEDNLMLGVVDVTLPNIAYVTDETAGAGIAGSLDTPYIGHTATLEITQNFRALTDNVLELISPNMRLITYRGTVQVDDSVSGGQINQNITVTTNAIPKALNLGTLSPTAAMGVSSTQEATYLKITVDGRELCEIDKINYIFRVNGRDYLEESRGHLFA